ncbi:MAG TPA: hypothetical protein VFB02_13725 [Bradyrhizobium sp.]|nr:hypothetical protein [Bradyrhizobium sp.]
MVDLATHGVRFVLIHLTEFAPDCRGLPLSHDRRWLRRFARGPIGPMTALLERLERPANTVGARALQMGDVGVFALDNKPTGYPLALIVEGLSAEQAANALMRIAAGDARGVAA